MKLHTLAAIAGSALLLTSVLMAGEAIKSGPQVGQRVLPFSPLNVNGDTPGENRCLVCKHGGNPVAMVFAREATEPVTTLIKKLNEATAKNTACEMGSFVVFCSDEQDLELKLKLLSRREKIKDTTLAIDLPAGPDDYKIARDAEVTVVLYVDFVVKANHALKKGELNDKVIDTVVKDLARILPEKK